MKTVIIDDEKQSRNALIGELKALWPEIEIIGEGDSVETSVPLINSLQPELVFLDINLGDGSGFNVLERISHHNFKLIFVTAYDQYALKAFRFNAMDYILKPINSEDLGAAISKIRKEEKVTHESSRLIENLLSNLQPNSPKRIPVPVSNGIVIFQIDEIIRCEADSNYTLVYTVQEEKLLAAKTLKDFEEMLQDFGFERIHHSHIVNLRHVRRYLSKDGGFLVMSDGSTVPIAQRKKAHVLTVIQNL